MQLHLSFPYLADPLHRVWDNDGEFLLIEAAYALPKWLKPDTAVNRVWLRDGALHLVPLPSPAAPSLPPAPTIQVHGCRQLMAAELAITESTVRPSAIGPRCLLHLA